MTSNNAKGPFRADHVGSLPRPERLLETRYQREDGEIGADELRRMEDECIAGIAARQEAAGLRSITDGEYRRAVWHLDFLSQFDNAKPAPGRFVVGVDESGGEDESKGFRPACMEVSGKLTRSHGIQTEDFKYLNSVVSETAKVCIPSPTLMHFRGGRDAVDKVAYPDMEGFFADVAQVYNDEITELAGLGLKYLQIDDTNLAFLCDARIRETLAQLGDEPDALLDTYIDLINRAIAGIPDDMTVCVHMCRGQFGKLGSGGYEPIAEKLFNRLHVNGFFMEYDDERSGDFSPLRHLPADKRVVLGLLTTKAPELESKDTLKRRIDAAAKFAPLENLALSAQCGFGTGVGGRQSDPDPSRRRLTFDEVFAKIGLIVETAGEVWGEI